MNTPGPIPSRRTALVTGGGGFLGRRIVEMLLAQGWSVRTFSRSRPAGLVDLGVDCRLGDLRDYEAVRLACQGIDGVFHTAANPEPWGDFRSFYETNTRGTRHVVEACVANGVPRLVYTSTPSVAIGSRDIVGGDESLPYPPRYFAAYPETKALAERYVLAADGRFTAGAGCLHTCALRPHLIWGPGDTHLVPGLLEAVRQGRLKIVGDGRNQVDLTYVDNAAIAHLQAFEALGPAGRANGKAYFIGDAQPVVLWDWINELLRRLEMPVLKKGISARRAWLAGAGCELVYKVLGLKRRPPMTRFLAMQLSQSHWFSHRRAREDFGYTPVVDNETGLQRLVAALAPQK